MPPEWIDFFKGKVVYAVWICVGPAKGTAVDNSFDVRDVGHFCKLYKFSPKNYLSKWTVCLVTVPMNRRKIITVEYQDLIENAQNQVIVIALGGFLKIGNDDDDDERRTAAVMVR